jgi:hypothetical protein
MSTIYNDCEVIIKVNDNNGGKFTKPIAVQGESQHGMDDPEFHANLLGQALYKIQQSGAQTTLEQHDNSPRILNLKEEKPPECTCEFYAMRSGVDTCSCADITTPEDCPVEYREEKKCPFRIITDEGQQAPGEETPALPPGTKTVPICDSCSRDGTHCTINEDCDRKTAEERESVGCNVPVSPKEDKKKPGKKPGKKKET